MNLLDCARHLFGRQAPKPKSTPHWHVCQECCRIWEHRENDRARAGRILNREAHECPACGCGPYYQQFTYRGARAEALAWATGRTHLPQLHPALRSSQS